jgi:hypothetical protein
MLVVGRETNMCRGRTDNAVLAVGWSLLVYACGAIVISILLRYLKGKVDRHLDVPYPSRDYAGDPLFTGFTDFYLLVKRSSIVSTHRKRSLVFELIDYRWHSARTRFVNTCGFRGN